MIPSDWNGILSAVLAAVENKGKLAPRDSQEAYETLSNPLTIDERDEICETLGLVIRKAPFDESFFVFPSSPSSMFALSQKDALQQLGSIMGKEEQERLGASHARAAWAVLYVFIVDWAFDRTMKPTCRAVERASVEDLSDDIKKRLQQAWEATKDDDEASAYGEVCASLYKRPMTDGGPVANENKATSTLGGAINRVLRFLASNGIFDAEELRGGFVVPTAKGCAAYQYGIASNEGTLPKLLSLLSPAADKTESAAPSIEDEETEAASSSPASTGKEQNHA